MSAPCRAHIQKGRPSLPAPHSSAL
jgi:hypothetical protein